MESKCLNCQKCQKTIHRTPEEKKKLLKRLNIIEGQIKGIQNMISEDRHCSDIIIQISAVENSLKSLGNVILNSHLKNCVTKEIKAGNQDAIDEVISLFEKLR